MSLSGLAAGILHDLGDENVVSDLFVFVAEHAAGPEQYEMFVSELRDYAGYKYNKTMITASGYRLVEKLADLEFSQLKKGRGIEADQGETGEEDTVVLR